MDRLEGKNRGEKKVKTGKTVGCFTAVWSNA